MKIRLAPWGIRSPKTLGHWPEAEPSCAKSFSDGNADHHVAQLGQSQEIFEKALKRIMEYRMFPEQRLKVLLSGKIPFREGDTVVQNARVGLFEFEIANRILETFDHSADGVREAGFMLASLKGHVETGVETFMIRQDSRGEVTFHVIANSRAGHWLTRLLSPLTRRVQLKATKECIQNMQELCR